jgi:hypothetical protein
MIAFLDGSGVRTPDLDNNNLVPLRRTARRVLTTIDVLTPGAQPHPRAIAPQ